MKLDEGVVDVAGSTLIAQSRYTDEALWREMWVSLASLLRSYTSAHGLNRSEQATVELGTDQIVVRAGSRWLKLSRVGAQVGWVRENEKSGARELTEEGTLKDESGASEELDMQAEAWARELMQ